MMDGGKMTDERLERGTGRCKDILESTKRNKKEAGGKGKLFNQGDAKGIK
jgi:hypothetical protein